VKPISTWLVNNSNSHPADRDAQVYKDALQELLKNMYDGIVICDAEGSILDANARLLEFIGHNLDDIRGRHILHLLSGANPDLMDTINQALASSRYVLLQAYGRNKAEQIFPVEISVNYLNLDQRRLCFFVRDISVRKKSEDLLKTGFNAISNCLSGIVVADPMGIIVYANPAAWKLWGYTSENQMKGQSILNLWSDIRMARKMIDAIMDGQNEWNGDLVTRPIHGSGVSLHVAAACNLDNEDEATGMVFSFVDISDRLRADAAVREAETRQAMLASLAAACHHLGQPATVLLASLGLLKDQNAKADPETVMLYNSAHDAAVKLSELLKKLSAINEYRTTDYLTNNDTGSIGSKILNIE